MNCKPIHASHRLLADGVNLLTPKVNLEPDFWQGDPPQVKRSFRASIAYRMCLVADGSFDGILSFRDAWEWDIAAGALIAARAGAIVSDGRGMVIEFNSPKARASGIFAASAPLHAELAARFKA
jgi:myo-inositol-1(or 4)-monophosphatase